jgi:hypothetical protein
MRYHRQKTSMDFLYIVATNLDQLRTKDLSMLADRAVASPASASAKHSSASAKHPDSGPMKCGDDGSTRCCRWMASRASQPDDCATTVGFEPASGSLTPLLFSSASVIAGAGNDDRLV